MRVGKALVVAASLVATTACYHQVIQTGRAPGPTIIEKPWTAKWVWGIIGATPINVSQQCKRGVATVETQMTVVNGLVYIITFGVYAPRDVKITCASGSAMKPGMQEFYVGGAASAQERETVLETAIDVSARSGSPVVVRF